LSVARVQVRRALRAAALVAALAGASGCGSSGAPATNAATSGSSPGAPTTATNAAPARCQAVVTQTVGQVAMRAYAELQRGRDAQFAARALARDTALGDAIARGDASAAVTAATTAARGHFTRLLITRNGQPIATAGRAPSLAPVRGVVRDRTGKVVADYAVSALRASDYAQLAAHLTDAQVQVTAAGQPSAARSAKAASGRTAVASTFSFTGEAFPSGRLTVTLGIPPADQLCGADPAATRANVIGGVAVRIYGAEAHSSAVTRSINAIAAYRPLIDAVTRNDARATRAAVTALLYNHTHIVRLRVTRGSRLLSDVGGPDIIAPSRGVLRDASGAVIGQFVMSLQDDLGFRLLTRRFTATHVVLRIGDRVIQGALAGAPPRLPDTGAVTIRGVGYRLYSFTAQAFPSGPLRVTLLVR
jgi:hypothetical protein